MRSPSLSDAASSAIFNLQFSIFNKTKRTGPKIPYQRIKDDILGKGYELSLILCGRTLSRRLNRIYRGRDYSTNVLSFPLSNSSGEIFIDLDTAKRETPAFGQKFSDFVLFLFIHGLLHLKGMRHGRTMEEAEKKLLLKHGAPHSSRNRRRNIPS